MLDEILNFWNIWSVASVAMFVLGILYAVWVNRLPYKKKRLVTPYRALYAGIFLAALVFILPLHFLSNNLDLISNITYTLFLSIPQAFRVFLMGGSVKDLTGALASIGGVPDFAQWVYTVFGSFLYFFAPLLTFGLVLSFFKNLSSYGRYVFSLRRNVHMFSDLNEKTLALAKSIAEPEKGKWFKKNLIVFTDIIDQKNEDHLALMEDAMELGAVLFRKDLSSIKLTRKNHSVYLLSENEPEKIRHARDIIADYKSRSAEKMGLYIFSEKIESKCFLESYTDAEKAEISMRVERVNDVRFLIYHYLNNHGIELFKAAKPVGDKREISVAVIGLGKYGLEIAKALLWYCQLPGYKINLNLFDRGAQAKTQFEGHFPSLVLDRDVEKEGDMQYRIRVFEGAEVGTSKFREKLEAVANELTHVFVCLGSDSNNISGSIAVKRILAQSNASPDITTIIYDTDTRNQINYPWADEGKPKKSSVAKYQIHAIGSFYSVGTVIDSQLSDVDGKMLNDSWMMTMDTWGVETEDIKLNRKNFYMNDYNFYSSVSRALHLHLRGDIVNGKADIKTVFPRLWAENNSAREYWYNFVISNTTDPRGAFVLKNALNTLLLSLPEDAQQLFKQSQEDMNAKQIIKKYADEQFALKINGGNDYQLSLEEIITLIRAAAEIEHIRWNAYMRSEGFVLGAKCVEHRIHNNLVTVDELSLFDCVKDV